MKKYVFRSFKPVAILMVILGFTVLSGQMKATTAVPNHSAPLSPIPNTFTPISPVPDNSASTPLIPVKPKALSTTPPNKMDLLVKAADDERQATRKQATDPNDALRLRNEAKQLRDQANKMK